MTCRLLTILQFSPVSGHNVDIEDSIRFVKRRKRYNVWLPGDHPSESHRIRFSGSVPLHENIFDVGMREGCNVIHLR